MRWFSHLERMDENYLTEILKNANKHGTAWGSKARFDWTDGVKSTLMNMWKA